MPQVRDKVRASWTASEVKDSQREVETLALNDAAVRRAILAWKGSYNPSMTNLAGLMYCTARFCHFDTELTRQTFPHLCQLCSFAGVAEPAGCPQIFIRDIGEGYLEMICSGPNSQSDEETGLRGYSFPLDRVHEASDLEVRLIQGHYNLLITTFPRRLMDEPYARRVVDIYLIKSDRVEFTRSDEYKLGDLKPFRTTYPDKTTATKPPPSSFDRF